MHYSPGGNRLCIKKIVITIWIYRVIQVTTYWYWNDTIGDVSESKTALWVMWEVELLSINELDAGCWILYYWMKV